MKAIVQTGYGSPAVLALRDMPQPTPGDREVLVEINAASVNALDWHVTRGMPRFLRLMEGIGTPRQRVRGVDLAGKVVSVGKEITRFKPGDEVFGGANGSFAEFTVTTEERLALKPASLSFPEASTLYVAALTAIQGLRDKAQVKPGQRVLVLGAGGGVGTFAVQLARWLGAQVTAVTRSGNTDLARSLGADQVIDYTKDDVTRSNERWDAVMYLGGRVPFNRLRRVMTPKAVAVVIGGPAGGWVEPMGLLLRAVVVSRFVSQRLIPFISKNSRADLETLAGLVAAGTIRPAIDREFPLAEAAAAIGHVGAGRARGKVVVRVR